MGIIFVKIKETASAESEAGSDRHETDFQKYVESSKKEYGQSFAF